MALNKNIPQTSNTANNRRQPRRWLTAEAEVASSKETSWRIALTAVCTAYPKLADKGSVDDGDYRWLTDPHLHVNIVNNPHPPLPLPTHPSTCQVPQRYTVLLLPLHPNLEGGEVGHESRRQIGPVAGPNAGHHILDLGHERPHQVLHVSGGRGAKHKEKRV